MEKRYKAYIDNIHFSIELEDIELCTFITHFGQFGNIELYDQKKGELVLNTVGIFIDKFYPDLYDRGLAHHKARQLYPLFKDYNYQRKRKYPSKQLKKQYNLLKELLYMD
ncbi:hypothetical protein ACWG0P_05765 [Amedibacillus sp. YH-ame6]